MNTRVATPYVLLADEDAAERKTLGDFITQSGWGCDIVTDGHSALEAASERDYDVIITDLVMPDIDGIQLLHGLRKGRPEQAIIIVSHLDDINEAVGFFREGNAIDVIEKPIDLELLESAIRRVLQTLRQKRFQDTIYRHVQSDSTQFEFTTAELAGTKLPFLLSERLYASGRIDFNTHLRLDLAFQEAMANGFEHGNLELKSGWKEEIDEQGKDKFSALKKERLQDPKFSQRKITIICELHGPELTISVEDEGPGFDTGKKRVPKEGEETSLQCHGRGRRIINGIMDEVSYEKGGRKIIMKKLLEQAKN